MFNMIVSCNAKISVIFLTVILLVIWITYYSQIWRSDTFYTGLCNVQSESSKTATLATPADLSQYTSKPAVDCPLCNVYNLQNEVTTNLTCVPLHSQPATTVCVYPPETDIYISKSIIEYGQWEGAYLAKLQSYLKRHPAMAVIDIGCNIGVYTIPIAQMGRKVLAVEPNLDHVIRVHRAARLGKLESRITLLTNAVSDIRGKADLKVHSKNQGASQIRQIENDDTEKERGNSPTVDTITMNDLVSFCDFHEAVLKIDIEGFEHKAFANAVDLFDAVYIPVVLMEWAAMKRFYNEPEDDPDRKLVIRMLEFFNERSFIPYDWDDGELSPSEWDTWPRDIVWIKKDRFL